MRCRANNVDDAYTYREAYIPCDKACDFHHDCWRNTAVVLVRLFPGILLVKPTYIGYISLGLEFSKQNERGKAHASKP
jgi:hypothetical protein